MAFILTASDLNSLLVDLRGLSDEQACQFAADCYKKEYLNSGVVALHDLHDGEITLFHATRFEHAFFTSSQIKGQIESKNTLDRSRIARIHWIKQIISGNVDKSACWEVLSRSGRPGFPNRLYVLYEPAYVVWLEPRGEATDSVRWKFSSAYPANPRHIRDKTRGGTCVWQGSKKSAP
jgi:hypothetical protein